jgi:hypothetical protein
VTGVLLGALWFLTTPPRLGEGWKTLLYERDPLTGYRHRPNERVPSSLRQNGELIYDVVYTTDARGRRVSPVEDEGREKFALFFGCSFTFGTGLEDADTIPSRFGYYAPEYRPYNYGIGASGPGHMWVKLKDPAFSHEIAEPSGAAFYVYLSFHKRRVAGTSPLLRFSAGGAPYFARGEKGEPEYLGTFASAAPFRLAWLLRLDRLQSWFRPKNELLFRPVDPDLFCGIVDEARRAFLARYPSSAFTVIVHPDARPKDPIVGECLRPRGLSYLDLRERSAPKGALHLPVDGHPTALSADWVAAETAASLFP